MIDLLTDRVSIRRVTGTTRSTTGVVTDDWTTVSTDVPASIQARSAIDQQLAAGQDEIAKFVGFFMPEADVRVEDEIVYEGATYLATFVKNVRGHHLEVDLESIDE